MDAIHDTTLDQSDAAFRECQAIRVAEAAAAFAETRALTCAQIGTLQTASRSAGNPQLRGIAAHVLDLWADEREPALAAMLRADPGPQPVSDAGGGVVYFDAWRDRRAARRSWDPLDTGRPCDTEQPA